MDSNLPGQESRAVDKVATFCVRDIPIYGDVILSPMAGYADIPHRAICRSFGSSMSYSEFVAAEDILSGSGRAISLLANVPEDKPMVYQIFGNNAQKILAAAQRVEILEPDIIDINMGCSTRRVSGRGAGVGMMLNPKLVEETFRLLSKHLTIPVTAKIRLGWNHSRNYREVARILEDNGASLIALHPRTKEQKYTGKADWTAITEIKRLVSIPVLGNGDIKTVEDVDRMLDTTGCDAVMIGRGAIGNPWIFARIDRYSLSWNEYASMIREHLLAMQEYYGERGLILFRKYLKRYVRGFLPLRSYSQQLIIASTYTEFFELLADSVAEYGQITTGSLRSSG